MLVFIQALMVVWGCIVAACAIMGVFILVKNRRERAYRNNLSAPTNTGNTAGNAHHTSNNARGRASL